MTAHDFRRPTPESVLPLLKRLALHFPRAKQLSYLDILAKDYCLALSSLTMADLDEAVLRAIAVCRHFPTVCELLAAHQEVLAQKRASQPEPQPQDCWTPRDREISRQRAKDVWQALKTGRRPDWMN